MAEETNGGLKRGCLIFLMVLLALSAGAGLSVIIKGKSMKPKSRALVVAKPRARLKEIKGKLAPDMPPEVRENFLKDFGHYTDALEKYGSRGYKILNPLSQSLKVIEADGVITTEEAKEWSKAAEKTLIK